MPKVKIAGVRLAGLAAAVPRTVAPIAEYAPMSPEERAKFTRGTGVERRRVAPPELCTSDLCAAAAERLLADLGWERAGVTALVFLTQTPDFLIPATAMRLQERLGLSTACAAFDMSMGCAGFVYGAWVACSLLAAAGGGRALVLVGETPSKITHPDDKGTAPLFGDAGAAAAFEFAPQAAPLHFDLGSDGRGWEAIIMRESAFRVPVGEASFRPREVAPGVVRAPWHLALDGVEIFNFSQRTVSASIHACLAAAGVGLERIDVCVLHQANRVINELIRQKLKLPPERCPGSLRDFGNTSSASIPLTLVSAWREQLLGREQLMLWSGFGVGLSWASAVVPAGPLACPPLLEL